MRAERRRTWESYSGGKWALGNLGEEALFRFAQDGSKVVPNVAKGVDIDEDATVFTIYLREGMKWSDGEDFDADDVLFYSFFSMICRISSGSLVGKAQVWSTHT